MTNDEMTKAETEKARGRETESMPVRRRSVSRFLRRAVSDSLSSSFVIRHSSFRKSPPPLILVSPDSEEKGHELGDRSSSLADSYAAAVMAGGGLPLVLPSLASMGLIREAVSRADGVLLTGGDDISPGLYRDRLPDRVRRLVAPADPRRDLTELLLLDEVFRQRKPLLAICRGLQLLNVSLGGDLIVDIASELPGALSHRQLARKYEPVHDVRLTAGSLLSSILQTERLGVNSTHHQAVKRVADFLWVAARSHDGVVEALEQRTDRAAMLPFLLAVQFHPERLYDRYAKHRRIFECFALACASHRDGEL
jgi:putative glutamine amidotransferase